MLHILYSAAARWRRRYAAGRHRLSRPVISIGNIAAGGRGKTPMAEVVARVLLDAGERPSILSRGYARERAVEYPVVVRDATAVRAGLAESGDEPLMLADRLDGTIIIVHPDRARAGAIAEQLGATVHVLDDGFQHVRLERDIDIVMLHPDDVSDQVMPAGRLREPVDALDYADAVVFIDDNESAHILAADAFTDLPARIFTAARRVSSPSGLQAVEPCFLVTGIAGADQASNAIRAAGWRVAGEQRFKDHHRYTAADADAVTNAATAAGAVFVLTTAKDAVRLREVWRSAMPLHIAELSLEIDERDAFDRWLIGRIAQARTERAESHRRAREDGARRAS
ncbi:MAG: tetraacyldisaccharide 4'-kinase [Vicinamibacterales bacterium]